jgi:hypothetical protein
MASILIHHALFGSLHIASPKIESAAWAALAYTSDITVHFFYPVNSVFLSQ